MTARRRVFCSPRAALYLMDPSLSHSSPGCCRRRRGRRRADGKYPPRTSSSRSRGG